MKSRKIVLFIISLIAIGICTFFGKDASMIVALYGVYCCGNVGSKFAYKNSNNSQENNKDEGV